MHRSIAIRFRNYIDNMRLRGHEVQVRTARSLRRTWGWSWGWS